MEERLPAPKETIRIGLAIAEALVMPNQGEAHATSSTGTTSRCPFTRARILRACRQANSMASRAEDLKRQAKAEQYPALRVRWRFLVDSVA